MPALPCAVDSPWARLPRCTANMSRVPLMAQSFRPEAAGVMPALCAVISISHSAVCMSTVRSRCDVFLAVSGKAKQSSEGESTMSKLTVRPPAATLTVYHAIFGASEMGEVEVESVMRWMGRKVGQRRRTILWWKTRVIACVFVGTRSSWKERRGGCGVCESHPYKRTLGAEHAGVLFTVKQA